MLKSSTLALCALLIPTMSPAQDAFETAQRTFDSMEINNGVTKGKRRNHTKGICFVGEFSPADTAIQQYSNSPIFAGTSTVNGRLSHKGGNNLAPDDKFGDYGLAFEITTADDDSHIFAMNTEDFFPFSRPEGVMQLMEAKVAGGDAVKDFAASSPELQAYKAHHGARDKTLRPYEGSTFNSINSFYLVDEAGEKTAIRWSFIPSTPQKVALEPTPDFLGDNLKANLAAGPVSWDMVVIFANPDDDILNPAIMWTGEHKQITAAKLTVISTSSETEGACDPVNFDPTLVSDGFEPSEDPMLEARSIIYAIGAGKRLSEK